ncbi:MAG: transposase [Boseongicola sp. SB0662_bin_57]|nr:transposase [Boseongicola sp. SB0662_bin_57]
MARVATHRQVVCRLLPQRRSTWRLLERTLEDQRQLWNAALEERIDCYRKTGRSLTYFDQCKALTQCRRDDPEIAACPVAIQRGTLKRLDEAYKHFFRRVRNGETPGFPKFKGRSRFDSISVVSGVKVRDGMLHVPGFGPLAVRRKGGNPYPDGKPVSAVLKRVCGRWTAVVCHAVEVEEPADNGRSVGLDRNGGQVADSDGELHVMPDMARLEARSRRLQRKLSRQRKASRRRERTKLRLARLRRKIANRRHNWHHHVSRRLAAKAGTVVVEGLDVKGMTRSAKGTVEAPGTKVAQKSGMNRVVRDTGWTALKRMLDCKAANVIVVPARNTSRTCHECGAVEAASRRTRDDFICAACGHAAHADLNAARNILALALDGRAGKDEAPRIGAPARREAFALATSTDP